MDIRKWLDETVLPDGPPSPRPPKQQGVRPVLYPEEPETVPEGRRRRRRSTSDSSMLDARPAHQKAPLTEENADIDHGGDDSACSDAYHPAHQSSGSSTSSQPYARRPRRKTRLERYEPTSKDVKERGREVYGHHKGESKKTKRKTRRKKAEKPGVGLVQSFHAKNVSKDRLTLKPREKLGLFNKGRASSPGKGRGLPDLVFSEMKFLQKHKDQPEAAPKAGFPSKKRKKDHADAKQEEIPAHFTAVRPALAVKDVNIQAKEGTHRKSLQRDTEHEREITLMIDRAIPTVELPGKAPYLGFGSRGPRRESESYISWSESIRAPSATPVRARAGSTINAGQPDSVTGGQNKIGTVGGDVLHTPAAPPSVPRHLTDGSGERFHVSSLTPANHRVSRSHSFPQRTYSPRPLGHDERAGLRHPLETAASQTSMPAAIRVQAEPARERHRPHRVQTDVRFHTLSGSPEYFDFKQDQAGLDSDERHSGIAAHEDPHTSSSLGRILQECNSAFDEGRRLDAASRAAAMLPPEPPTTARNEPGSDNAAPYGTIRRLPTVRFAGVERCRPPVANYPGPSIYEEQERRQQMMEQPYDEDDNSAQDSYSVEEEDEEFDEIDGLAYDEQEWQEFQGETVPHDLDMENLVDDPIHPLGVEHGQQELGQSDNVAARRFWRPNKLY